MAYSKQVIDRNEKLPHSGSLNKDSSDVGTGFVGAPSCGDVMRLQLLIQDGKIIDAKFKTFGCGSAIASSSLAAEMLLGKTIAEVESMVSTINEQIATELALPPVKFHCSVLARGAIIAALRDYRQKQERLMSDGQIEVLVPMANEG